MIRAEGNRSNRAETDKKTPNGNGKVVKEGFLEERTPDLYFGRGQVSEERRKAELAKTRARSHTVYLGNCQSSLWIEGRREDKAGLKDREDLGSHSLTPPKCRPQS